MKTILVCTENPNFEGLQAFKTLFAGVVCFGIVVSSAQAERESGERGSRGGGRPRGGGHEKHHPEDHEEMFKRMDKDGDGRIRKEEFFAIPRLERLPEEKREHLFARLDRDGDGSLSLEEISQMRKDAMKRGWKRLRELDADGSAGVSFEEFSRSKFFQKLPEERRQQIFDRMDSDGDGEITARDKPKGPPHPQGGARANHPERPEGRDRLIR